MICVFAVPLATEPDCCFFICLVLNLPSEADKVHCCFISLGSAVDRKLPLLLLWTLACIRPPQRTTTMKAQQPVSKQTTNTVLSMCAFIKN